MEKQIKESEKKFDGIVLSIPKKYAYPHHFTTKEGEERVVVKLPPHMPEMDTEEGRLDPSGMALFCSEAQLKSYENDPNYYSVILPSKNSQGAPWEVKLHWSKGHWENPDEKGNFIVDDEGAETVSAQELARALQARRSAARKFAASAKDAKAADGRPTLREEGLQSSKASQHLSGADKKDLISRDAQNH